MEDQKRLVQAYVCGMHGRGSQASAPVSDVAGRGDAGGSPQTARPCHVVLHRATWRFPNRADAAEIGADTVEIGANSVRIGRYRPNQLVSAETAGQAEIQKKKKKVQNAPFDLT